jgi:hypothetical protein
MAPLDDGAGCSAVAAVTDDAGCSQPGKQRHLRRSRLAIATRGRVHTAARGQTSVYDNISSLARIDVAGLTNRWREADTRGWSPTATQNVDSIGGSCMSAAEERTNGDPTTDEPFMEVTVSHDGKDPQTFKGGVDATYELFRKGADPKRPVVFKARGMVNNPQHPTGPLVPARARVGGEGSVEIGGVGVPPVSQQVNASEEAGAPGWFEYTFDPNHYTTADKPVIYQMDIRFLFRGGLDGRLDPQCQQKVRVTYIEIH